MISVFIWSFCFASRQGVTRVHGDQAKEDIRQAARPENTNAFPRQITKEGEQRNSPTTDRFRKSEEPKQWRATGLIVLFAEKRPN
jgi:hypothetical protein